LSIPVWVHWGAWPFRVGAMRYSWTFAIS
jgi:hypothetical protein